MTNDAGLIEELRATQRGNAVANWQIVEDLCGQAADRLTSQQAEITGLKASHDRVVEWSGAELGAIHATIDGLVEALGPFAIVGDLYSDGSLQSAPGGKEVEFCFRVSDFRRVRQALERVSDV